MVGAQEIEQHERILIAVLNEADRLVLVHDERVRADVIAASNGHAPNGINNFRSLLRRHRFRR